MKGPLFILGIILAAVLALFGYQKAGEWRAARLAKWRTDSARVADASRDAERRSAEANIKYDTTRLRYVEYRDRIVRSGTATPRDSATFARCDAVELTCAGRHAADSLEKVSLRDELRVARAKPSEKAPRLQAYAEGLYDFLHAVPVFRAGAELRIIGEIRATAAGDLSVPSAADCQAGRCAPTTRALIGIRYVF